MWFFFFCFFWYWITQRERETEIEGERDEAGGCGGVFAVHLPMYKCMWVCCSLALCGNVWDKDLEISPYVCSELNHLLFVTQQTPPQYRAKVIAIVCDPNYLQHIRTVLSELNPAEWCSLFLSDSQSCYLTRPSVSISAVKPVKSCDEMLCVSLCFLEFPDEARHQKVFLGYFSCTNMFKLLTTNLWRSLFLFLFISVMYSNTLGFPFYLYTYFSYIINLLSLLYMIQ